MRIYGLFTRFIDQFKRCGWRSRRFGHHFSRSSLQFNLINLIQRLLSVLSVRVAHFVRSHLTQLWNELDYIIALSKGKKPASNYVNTFYYEWLEFLHEHTHFSANRNHLLVKTFDFIDIEPIYWSFFESKSRFVKIVSWRIFSNGFFFILWKKFFQTTFP